MSAENANVPKRVFGYLIDTFLISMLVLVVVAVTQSPLASSVCNFLGVLLRDAVTPHGSPGKRFAGLRLELRKPGLAAQVTNSVLRNLPFGVPLLFACFQTDPSVTEQAVISLALFLVIVVELWKLYRTGGQRYGDLLAGDRVVDPQPQESRWRYAAYAVATVALSFAIQGLATHFLPAGQ